MNLTINQEATLEEALSHVRSNGRRLVVVVDKNNKVVGVLSEGDIDRSYNRKSDLKKSVKTCMNKNFVSVKKGTRKEQVLKLLDASIRALPVLDEKNKFIDLIGAGYITEEKVKYSRARAPARISFSGGGTDFTEYFSKAKGSGLSCTLAKYSHAILFPREDKKINIYSNDFEQNVKCKDITYMVYDGTLDLIKAGINMMKPDFGFDLQIGCDFPPASGLGGSASLLASVVASFNEFGSKKLSRYEIAEFAYEAERIELEIAGGWQDQYSTVFGGFNFLEFRKENNTVLPIRLEDDRLNELQERMMLLPTGKRHQGQKIQNLNTKKNSRDLNFKATGERLQEIAELLKIAFLRGDYSIIGPLLTETWDLKRKTNPLATNQSLDKIFNTALSSGADGGRLLGTGGGGYFLFFVNPSKKYEFINKMKNEFPKLEPEQVIFDNQGVLSWVVKN